MINLSELRVDKWLCAARFFKTRSTATKAVNGGNVYLNGKRIKPAKNVQAGDEIIIQKGRFEFTIIVKAINDKRRSVAEAALLYEETEESVVKRQDQKSKFHKAAMLNVSSAPPGRPNKRERRLIRSFTRKE